MINNRQNGRRRGRNGQRPGGGGNPGRPESGNRIDSRARGNAGQLLEKYKALASDAQRQGDRVNTEYYLQFADHYFRVLAESRPRFEDQQQPAQRRGGDGYDDEFDGEGGDEFGQEGESGTPDQSPRGDDRPRQDDRARQEPRNEGRSEGRNEARGDGRQEGRRDDRYRQDRQPDRQGEPRQQEVRRESRDGGRDGGRPRYDEQRAQEGNGFEPRRDAPRDGERSAAPNAGAAGPVDVAERPAPLPVGAPTGDEVLTAVSPRMQEASTMRAADMDPAGGVTGDAPAPRRRGRPPRVRVDEAAEAPSGFDAALLPPSLSVSASAEPDAGEPVDKPRRRRRIAAPVEAGSAS